MKRFFVLSLIIVCAFLCDNSYAMWDDNLMCAMHYPTVIAGRFADHTYICLYDPDIYDYDFYSPSVQRPAVVERKPMTMLVSCFAPIGGNSGGDYLSESMGVGNIEKAKCVADYRESTCEVVYGWEGVCHQNTNRALYPTRGHKTVKKALGYKIFFDLYGAYGKFPKAWKQCKSVCALN